MTGSAGTAASAVMTVRTGMTGSAGTVASAVMTVRTGMAPETCNSSPGNANRPIGTQAGHDEDKPPGFAAEICPGTYLQLTDHKSPLPIGRLAFPGWRILCFESEYFGVGSI